MKLYLTLAWRNLWRNKRRSIITMTSVAFAVILSVLLYSVKEGFLDKMQENAVSFFTGYIQIHKTGFWDDQTLDNTVLHSDSLVTSILDNKDVLAVAPRLESFALSASIKHSKVSMVVGIDPEQEHLITNLKDKLVEGEYLAPSDQEALVTQGLMDYLQLKLNDSIVLLGQGYHGVTAVGKYRIKGVLKFGSPELNKRLVYLPLKEAQWLYGAENRLTAYVLELPTGSDPKKIASDLLKSTGEDYEVLPWQTMLPELEQMIQGEDAETVIFLFILYMLISFGIFGTILMMTMERSYEFGMMMALGMKKRILAVILVIESILVTFLGALIGLLLSFPFIYYLYLFPVRLSGQLADAYENFGIEPIYYFSIEGHVFYSQALIVLIVALVLSIYPVIRIKNLKPVSAMRE